MNEMFYSRRKSQDLVLNNFRLIREDGPAQVRALVPAHDHPLSGLVVPKALPRLSFSCGALRSYTNPLAREHERIRL